MKSDGQLMLPLAVLLCCLALASFGTWGILRHWRSLVETQLRLDDCVGKTALALRGTQRALEAGNLRMKALRASIAAATFEPWAIPPLKAALEAQALAQRAVLLAWNARRAAWLLARGCDGTGDPPRPLPTLSWLTPPPDALGPQPLRWTGGRSMHLQLDQRPRHAAAEVYAREKNGIANALGSRSWSARWAPATKAFGLGPSID